MSLTTPLIFQVHAVPESIALCWPASVEGQVLRAILSPKAFANVCKRVQGPKYLDWLRIQDSRFKIQKNFLNPETLLILAPGFKKFFWDLES